MPPALLEHGPQNLRRLLGDRRLFETHVYKNTGFKLPAPITCYNTGYTVC